ncbi:hypothetical protein EYF80_065548 [Liparis tanakae]|uniref:Uncharacterized protein n=1 Tax=Liparis tanakae TaxID=230148 RepID=A0A4Z2E6F3_9TELE|nr:hypothetical protein EYF80_065548 [Liparis tanakae]
MECAAAPSRPAGELAAAHEPGSLSSSPAD